MAKADDGEHSFLSDDEASFILRQVPPRRVFVVGGVHITQFLAPMARQAGYDVTIIDPREVFSTAERFPGSACLTAWPDEAMEGLKPDARTAVVTLTHDPKIDDPGLVEALPASNITQVWLNNNKLTDAGVATLAAGLPDTKVTKFWNQEASVSFSIRRDSSAYDFFHPSKGTSSWAFGSTSDPSQAAIRRVFILALSRAILPVRTSSGSSSSISLMLL